MTAVVPNVQSPQGFEAPSVGALVVDQEGNVIGESDDVTLLSGASSTGSSSTVPSGVYTWTVYGTWDGATATLQVTPNNGSTWISADEAIGVFTENAMMLCLLPNWPLRVAISGAGGSTSISSKLKRVA